MSASLKKVTVLIVVAFLIFYLLTRPTEFANTLEDIAGWFGDAFDSIIRFFQSKALKSVNDVMAALKRDGSLAQVADRLAGFEERQQTVDKARFDALEQRYR